MAFGALDPPRLSSLSLICIPAGVEGSHSCSPQPSVLILDALDPGKPVTLKTWAVYGISLVLTATRRHKADALIEHFFCSRMVGLRTADCFSKTLGEKEWGVGWSRLTLVR